jgi:flagellar motor switch protein FliN
MMQSFQNQRANTAAGGARPFGQPNNPSAGAPQPLPAAEIESLLKLAYENLRQLKSRTPVDEIGPGDVQYLRGDSVPAVLPSYDASTTDWLPMHHSDSVGMPSDESPAGALSEVQHDSLNYNVELPEICEAPDATSPNRSQQHGLTLDDLGDVELEISIELGRTEVLIEDLLKLREGSVVALDKLAGDPVDIVANGRLVGRGELLVVDGKFGVRLSEVL